MKYFDRLITKLKNINKNVNKNIDKNRLAISSVAVVLSFSLVAASAAVVKNNETFKQIDVESNMYKLLSMTEYYAGAPIDVKDSVTSDEIITGYGLYVGEKFITASEHEKDLIDFVEKYISDQVNSYDVPAAVEFTNGYHTQLGFYSSDKMISEKDAKDLLNSCSKTVTLTETETSSLPFKTITKKSKDEYTDYKKVTKKGSKGSAETTYSVTYVDGVETERTQISYKVAKKPVDKVITVGTKIRKGEATGDFLWPSPACYSIYSGFGYREDGFHKGIDISGCGIYGTDVVASDGGTVICANFHDYGYGYHVEIDHGNGYVTRYAHLSDIFVSVGDKVNQGDLIGAVGSTGDSEGPHLHFEIIVGGGQVDPEPYLR